MDWKYFWLDLKDTLQSLWRVKVYVKRTTMGGQERTSVKWFPRMLFTRCLEWTFRRGWGVYWSPRRVVWEGEIVYKHHFIIESPRIHWS